MGRSDMILLRNIGIASAVVIAVIVLFSIVGYSDENSCQQVVQEYSEMLEAVCPDEYLEWGYDSAEECVYNKMALYDPKECM